MSRRRTVPTEPTAKPKGAKSVLAGEELVFLVELVRENCNLAVRCRNEHCGHAGVIDGRRLYFWFVTNYGYDSFALCRRKLLCMDCDGRDVDVHPTIEQANDGLAAPDETHYCMRDITIARGV